jgi:hypothetical protein
MPENAQQTPNYDREALAAGSDFYSNSSEINVLNEKRTFDEFQDISLTAARRSQEHSDELKARSLKSLDELQSLQSKINQEFFTGRDSTRVTLAEIMAQRARNANMWDYETGYDLGNPTTTGVGDSERSDSIPANRAADVAASGVAAGVSESVQTNVTSQISALTVQLGTVVTGLQTLVGLIPVIIASSGTSSNSAQPPKTA